MGLPYPFHCTCLLLFFAGKARDLVYDLGFDSPFSRWGKVWKVRGVFQPSSSILPFMRYLDLLRFGEEALYLPGTKVLSEEHQNLDVGVTWTPITRAKLSYFSELCRGYGVLRYTYHREPYGDIPIHYSGYLADLKRKSASTLFSRSLIGRGFTSALMEA